MKAEIEKKITARVAAAFADIVPGPETKAGQDMLKNAEELVRALWLGKIYAALPKDKTSVPEYFLDAELEQFLNEAVEECHKRICSIARRASENFNR